MKREISFWQFVVFCIMVAGLLADDVSKRAELKAARAELAQWEIYSTLTMNHLWALQYDEAALRAPERKMPTEAPERLLALAERVEGRLDRCEIAKARLEVERAGGIAPPSY